MASVLNVYNALKNLSNKEQKGFITPNVFNSFAPIAQMNVYNELLRDFTSAKQQSRAGLDPGRHRSPRKMTAEDLSIYVRDQSLSVVNGNIYSKPEDLGRIISMRVDGESRGSGSDRVMCEMVYDVEKMNAILGSNLSTPTDQFPVALVSQDIEVFPDTVSGVYLTYYALPTSYSYGTKNILPLDPQIQFLRDVPDLSVSTDFMIPDEYEPELIAEMARLLGVRLRDVNLQQYGVQEEAAG
jgi:hypothetical protein